MQTAQEFLEKTVRTAFAFLLEDGYSFASLYEKGSDSSCSYIFRFQKGKNQIDLRTLSGGGGSVLFLRNGEYFFPNLERRHKPIYRAFRRKHFFKKATEKEKWELLALVIKAELALQEKGL